MKQGLTIQQLAQELLRQSQAKEDYLVNTANLQMESDAGTPALRLLDDNGVDQIEPLEIQTIAHRQLGDYLSIPRKYYDRMLKENPELLALNVNSWLHSNPEQRMIRTIYGRARAFLSNIYFMTYANSLESNLMQMVLVKEKLNLFMKGQDTDLDEIYERFGIDYNLLSLLLRQETDDNGHLQIRWGEQKIA